MIFDIFQLVGGFILAFGYLPQIVQIIKTRSTRDLNLKTFILVLLGITLMEVYAVNLVVVHQAGLAFLITNTVSLCTAIVMVILIIKYRET